jgi:hypothetical protein
MQSNSQQTEYKPTINRPQANYDTYAAQYTPSRCQIINADSPFARLASRFIG